MDIIILDENEDLLQPKYKSTFYSSLKRYVSIKTLTNILLSASVISILVFLIYLCKNYLKAVLFWIEIQNPWIIFILFLILFVIVSFPVTVGYLILIITSGYLFGFAKGLPLVVCCANFGVAVAHNTLRLVHNRLPVNKLIQNETTRGILRVISGPQAFKVVFFARLTPIPFGLQNVIFAVSTVGGRNFHIATLLGLLPAQIINVYLGSTLRSMHEVLNDHNTAVAGYCILAAQIVVGVSLMTWVVHKARQELTITLQGAEGLQGVCVDC